MPSISPRPGYWQASDGQWYPPELHPQQAVPAPANAPAARLTAPPWAAQTQGGMPSEAVRPPWADSDQSGPTGAGGVPPTQAPPPMGSYGSPQLYTGGSPGRVNSRRRLLIPVVAAVVLIGLLAGGAFGAFLFSGHSTQPSRFTLPNQTATVTFPVGGGAAPQRTSSAGFTIYLTSKHTVPVYGLATVNATSVLLQDGGIRIPASATPALFSRYVVDNVAYHTSPNTAIKNVHDKPYTIDGLAGAIQTGTATATSSLLPGLQQTVPVSLVYVSYHGSVLMMLSAGDSVATTTTAFFHSLTVHGVPAKANLETSTHASIDAQVRQMLQAASGGAAGGTSVS